MKSQRLVLHFLTLSSLSTLTFGRLNGNEIYPRQQTNNLYKRHSTPYDIVERRDYITSLTTRELVEELEARILSGTHHDNSPPPTPFIPPEEHHDEHPHVAHRPITHKPINHQPQRVKDLNSKLPKLITSIGLPALPPVRPLKFPIRNRLAETNPHAQVIPPNPLPTGDDHPGPLAYLPKEA